MSHMKPSVLRRTANLAGWQDQEEAMGRRKTSVTLLILIWIIPPGGPAFLFDETTHSSGGLGTQKSRNYLRVYCRTHQWASALFPPFRRWKKSGAKYFIIIFPTLLLISLLLTDSAAIFNLAEATVRDALNKFLLNYSSACTDTHIQVSPTA